MLFNTTAPTQQYNVQKNFSNDPLLSVMGFNPDGTKNSFGQLASYLPGYGVISDFAADQITKNTDTNSGIKGNYSGDAQKLLAEAAIAATVLTAGAGAPAIGATAPGAVESALPEVTGATGPSFAGMQGANLLGGTAQASSMAQPIEDWVKKQALDQIKKQGVATNQSNMQNNASPMTKSTYSLDNYNGY